jgi:hypothetical protein
MLVAKGNIYVGKNVTRLDGMYVAQAKNDGSGGVIFTCAVQGGYTGYGDTTKFDNCGGPGGEGAGTVRQLTVNGAFIAKDIKLDRVHKSVRDSCRGEYTSANPSWAASCPATQASEIFNFSPEMWLSQPPFASDASGFSSTSRFQYYTTLPPVL